MPDSTNYESALAHQLAMNKETWAALQQHGLTDQSKVRLDFTYLAPSRDAANALEQFLRDDSDYDLSVQSQGSFFRKTWTVTGTTQETAVFPEVLDQWVTWMVAAGRQHQCKFDGWGTSV